jgi:peptidoglycan/xylan/chitin deacetylase (PgdA/CDA1 family)
VIPLPAGRTAAATWRLPVLMYHSVANTSVETAPPRAVAKERLAEQLGALAGAGWELVGLTEALAILDAEPGRRVVALTFDDGLLDFHNAHEVMQDLGARSTLYVPTELVGQRGSWLERGSWREEGTSTLDWSELADLSSAGVEIGSHSCTHRPLDVLPPAAVAREVADSRRALEDRLGTAVTSFSYPHGYTSRAVTTAVRRAGYRNACIVGRRIAVDTDDRFAIPRIEARPTVDAPAVHTLVGAGEPGLAPAAKRVAMPAWRATRRAAFTVLHRELT